MEEITKKKFSELPEHTQMFLNSLLADYNYTKGATYIQNDAIHAECKSRYEKACLREGVEPYVQE
jgi:hypothetical protein